MRSHLDAPNSAACSPWTFVSHRDHDLAAFAACPSDLDLSAAMFALGVHLGLQGTDQSFVRVDVPACCVCHLVRLTVYSVRTCGVQTGLTSWVSILLREKRASR